MSTKVTKHWGHEIWIADGLSTPYALKRIMFKAGNRTSLQVHQYKIETAYVLSGTGVMYKSKEKLDIEKYLSEGMTEKEVEALSKPAFLTPSCTGIRTSSGSYYRSRNYRSKHN